MHVSENAASAEGVGTNHNHLYNILNKRLERSLLHMACLFSDVTLLQLLSHEQNQHKHTPTNTHNTRKKYTEKLPAHIRLAGAQFPFQPQLVWRAQMAMCTALFRIVLIRFVTPKINMFSLAYKGI